MRSNSKLGTIGRSAPRFYPSCHRYRRWASVAALLACASPAFGTTSTWVSPISGTWITPGNWSTNPVVPNAIDDSATLGTSTANETITLNAPVTLGNLTFDSPFGYTVAPGTGNLTLQTSAGNASLTVTSSLSGRNELVSAPISFASSTTITNNATLGNLTLSGNLTGSSDITFNGSSPIILSGNNSLLTSNLFINAANVTASSASALGTGNITINAGGAFNISAATGTTKTFILNGGTLHSNTLSFVNLNGKTSVTADSAISGSGGNIMIGLLTGSANLSLSNSIFTFFGNNTFTGNLNLNAGANVTVGFGLVAAQQINMSSGSSLTFIRPVGTDPTVNSFAPGSIHATGGYLGVSGVVDFRPALASGATLDGILINTTNATLGGTNSLDLNAFANPTALRIGGNGSIASTMDIRPDLATHTFRFGLAALSTAAQLTLNNTLADHDGASANFDLNGSGINGTMILPVANTYTGISTIANATLQLNNANDLGSGSGTDADGTILNANGSLRLGANLTLSNEKITVNPNATLTANNTTAIYAGPIVMNGGTLAGGNYTGQISGSGNFNVTGGILSGNDFYTGNLTFTGSSTVASGSALSSLGNTIIANGTVTLKQDTNVPLRVTGGILLLAAGVTLSSSNITLVGGTITGANLTATYADPITIAGSGSLISAVFSGTIGGPGNFTVFGSTLSGIGNYTGTESIVGNTNITNANAFSALGNTIITATNVTISAPVSVPFSVTGGVTFITAAASSNITLAGGTVVALAPITGAVKVQSGGTLTYSNGVLSNSSISITNGTLSGNATLSSPITITGNGTIGGGGSNLTLLNGIFATGNLTISDFQIGNLTSPNLYVPNTVSVVGNLNQSGAAFVFAGNTTITGNTTLQSGRPFFTGSATFVGPFLGNNANGSIQNGIFDSSFSMINTSFLTLNGPTAFHGPVVFSDTDSTVVFNGAATFDFPLALPAQTLLFNANNSISGITLSGGNLTTGNNATLTSLTPYDFQSGLVQAALAGPAINKSSFGILTLKDVGQNFSSPINVLQGVVVATYFNPPANAAPLGSASVNVNVATNNALIDFYPSTIPATINLSNSTGVLLHGALTGSAFLTGSVNLGATGSIIGSQNATLEIDGPVNGGALTAHNRVILTNPANTFTGPTILSRLSSLSDSNANTGLIGNYQGTNAGVILENGGRLLSTSSITIDRGGDLTVDQTGTTTSPDAVGNNIPITLNGGALDEVNGPVQGAEAFGNVTLAQSDSIFTVFGGGSISIANLTRQPGATAFFNTNFSSISSEQVFLGNAPTLTNGIIGGWAVTYHLITANIGSELTFATYGPNGVVSSNPTESFIGTTPATNLIGEWSGVYTSNLTINSLAGGVQDMGGHLLTVVSGGMLTDGSATLGHGSITSGLPGVGGELFYYTGPSDVNCGYNFIDNAGGMVSLVKWGRGSLILSGNNTYTGPTYVNEGFLYIDSAASLPSGNVLNVNGGAINFEVSDPTVNFQLTSLSLRQYGFVNGSAGGASITAAAYSVESGTLNARLIGSAPIQKTTLGTAYIGLLTNEYTGPINVTQGVVVACLTSTALGSGTVTVNSGAYLVNDVFTLSNPIQLAGDLSGSSINSFTNGSGNVTFTGPLTVNGAATVTTFDTLANLTTIGGNQTLKFTALATISANCSLTKIGGGGLQFNGGLVNNGSFSFDQGSTTVSGMTGSGNTTFSSGGTLIATGSITQNVISNNGSLVFNNSSNITINANTLSGTGALSQNGNATTIITANYTGTGPISLSAGKITFTSTSNLRQDTGVVLKMTSLSIAPTSILDITNHDLIIGNSNLTTINTEVLNGFGAGPGGAKITSSTAIGGAPTFLIPIDAAAMGITSWNNVPVDQPNSIIVRYTTFGDANLDGLVNSDDFGVVISHIGTTSPGIANIERAWLDGDVNLDGLVNADDFGVIISNLGSAPLIATSNASGVDAPSIATPEPASFSLLTLAAAPALLRRRRNRAEY